MSDQWNPPGGPPGRQKTVRQQGNGAIVAAVVAGAGAVFFFYKSVIWFGERVEGPALAILLGGLVFAGVGVRLALKGRRLLRQAEHEEQTGTAHQPEESKDND